MEAIGFLNEKNDFSDDWYFSQESFCPASESTASHNSRLPSIHNTSYEFQSRQPFCIALASFSDQTPVRTSGFAVNGTVEYRLIYAGQLSPIAKVDATGTVLETYVYGLGVNSPDYIIKDGTQYKVIKDHLGSMRMIVDSTTGTVEKSISYDEFGNITNETGTLDTIFGYAGGIRDTDTGLTKFGARWYDPVTGRWIEKEPLGFAGSDNFYSYCDGDPINWIDPTGLYKTKSYDKAVEKAREILKKHVNRKDIDRNKNEYAISVFLDKETGYYYLSKIYEGDDYDPKTDTTASVKFRYEDFLNNNNEAVDVVHSHTNCGPQTLDDYRAADRGVRVWTLIGNTWKQIFPDKDKGNWKKYMRNRNFNRRK